MLGVGQYWRTVTSRKQLTLLNLTRSNRACIVLVADKLHFGINCECSGNCDDFANVHSTIHVLFRGTTGTGKKSTVDQLTNQSIQSNSSGTNETDEEWLVIDPRLTALGATPLAGLVDMWYGTSSVSAKFDSVTYFLK